MAGGDLRDDKLHLLAVNIPVLLANRDLNFLQSLQGISDSYYTVDQLESMARNARNELYVLVGIQEEGLVICSVVQVYIEGSNIRLPSDNSVPMKMEEYYKMFPQLSEIHGAAGFNTANIVQCCSVSEDYNIAALDRLTRYYNKKTSEYVSDEPESRHKSHRLDQSLLSFLSELKTRKYTVHFLGRIIELNVADLNKCLMKDFSLLFVGKPKEDYPVRCVVIKALEAYNGDLHAMFDHSRETFIGNLSYGHMKQMNPEFALRVLEVFNMEIAATRLTKTPWNGLDELRMRAYTGNNQDLELVQHMIPLIALLYFKDRLLLMLSEQAKHLLFITGLQQRDITKTLEALEVTKEAYRVLVGRILSEALGYFDTLRPEVVDP